MRETEIQKERRWQSEEADFQAWSYDFQTGVAAQILSSSQAA
jgi:hypothetical protein